MSEIDIRPARCEDAAGIVAAIRSGMRPELLDVLIYGCYGITEFVREQIAGASFGSDTAYTVACDGEVVAGAIELRLMPDALFVNYISVLPEFQSMGLGGRLLRASVETSRQDRQTRLLLDVMDDNHRARAWYDSLGFREETSQTWYALDPGESSATEQGLVSGYPQAIASYERFGFGGFSVTTAGGVFEVGMLGRRWFRLTKAEGLTDRSLQCVLAKMDASRRVLAIVGGEQPCTLPDGAAIIATSHRLSTVINLD